MIPEVPANERLASLEAKLEFIQDLLKEIRDDIKDQPSREEYMELKNKVSEIEKEHETIKVKMYTITAIISLLFSSLGAYLLKLIIGR